jgi:hypothetical protein
MRTGLGICLLLSVLASGCNQREIGTCDITQRDCQVSVYYRVVNLRGDGYDPFGGLPPVTVISEDQFRAMLEEEAAREQATRGPSPVDKALALLHFTSSPGTPDAGIGSDGGGADGGSSTIDDEVTHIYAFYDPTSKTITIISHPSQTDSYARENAMVTLAHELVHALQDREIDLLRDDFRTSDEYLAFKGTVEGDARFYENLFTEDVRRMLGMPPRDALAMPDQDLDWVYANFDQVGSPYFAADYLMYPLGAKYEASAYRSGGNTAVRHAYAKAPIRTVGFLVGPDGRAPPVGTGDVCPAPAAVSLPTTGKTAGWDQFGAVSFYAFLRGWGVAHDVAFAAAQTWTGDFLRVQATADLSTTAVAWRLEFSADPPGSIAAALGSSGELSVSTGPGRIEITATDASTPLTWKASAGCQ